jgi:hypothetical protein
MESTICARAIAIVMTTTQLLVIYADAKMVMMEIPTIPLAAQVNFLFILLFNVTLPIFLNKFLAPFQLPLLHFKVLSFILLIFYKNDYQINSYYQSNFFLGLKWEKDINWMK